LEGLGDVGKVTSGKEQVATAYLEVVMVVMMMMMMLMRRRTMMNV
jgi:hypothetical protein